MLKRIGLKNFKAFRNLGPEPGLELKPITVLAGANSSGKSSLIHALLLLKQTLMSRREDALALNGEFLNFSSYDEIVFGRQKNASITFSLELANSTLPDSLVIRLSEYFNRIEVNTIRKTEQVEKYQGIYNITIESSERKGQKEITVNSTTMLLILAGTRQQAELNLKRSEESYIGTVSVPDPKQEELLPSEVIKVNWSHFLPKTVTYRPRNKLKESSLDLLTIPIYTELVERLHYIGPLRSEPQRAYLMLGDRVDLGYRGEYTAQVLLREWDKPVDYLINNQIQAKSVGLLEAVNNTLEMMDLPPVTPISREGVVSQLMLPLIGDDSPQVTLVDVGFGVSQVLPIIVAGLQANKGEILVFEQPETHLHPKIQDSLADFFILLHRLGKQVIVETHSDHLINGLRLRIVADPSDTLKDDILIAFVRPPELKGQGSRVESLEFDEYGMITNWPPEFMSESMKQMQEILRLGVEKRRKKRNP